MRFSWERWLRGYEVVYEKTDELNYTSADWIGKLASEIRYAHKNWGFIGMFIFGRQAVGKTTLALTIASRVYDGNWWTALKYLYFDPADIERAVKSAIRLVEERQDSEARLKTLIWDDAGVWASKYYIRVAGGIRYAMSVQNLVELASGITASIIVTATAPDRTLTPFRTQEWYYIRVSGPYMKKGEKTARATIYQLAVTPLEKLYVKRVGRNLSFKLHIPQDVYRRYRELMIQYMRNAPLDFTSIFGMSGEKDDIN
jgi:hypothetical protein